MGNFYTNFTVRSDDQAAVVELLREAGRVACVTPAANGWVVVYDRDADMAEHEIAALCEPLSKAIAGPVLAVMNYDDDILMYWLYENGRETDRYHSFPDFFGDGSVDDTELLEQIRNGTVPENDAEPMGPSGGDPAILCEACGTPDAVASVRKVLHDDGSMVVAVFRHVELVKALRLPNEAVGYGYGDMTSGSLPRSLEKLALKWTQ